MNSHVYQKQLQDRGRKVLFVVDAGNDHGYGHLMRCRELALQITERLGWSTRFLTNDAWATSLLLDVGIPVENGTDFSIFSKNDSLTCVSSSNSSSFRERSSIDMIVFDLAPDSFLPSGWRKKLPSTTKIVVLDRTDDWAMEADLVIIPSITAPEQEEPKTKELKILCGRKYIILRREVGRLVNFDRPKDIDVLAYLHHTEQRETFSFLEKHSDLRIVLIEQPVTDFHHLLARSRILVSGFGISFYEALALGTFPVTWAYSPVHQEQARIFYQKAGIRERILPSTCSPGKVEKLLKQTLRESPGSIIDDGTPNIVNSMRNLFEQD
ncbi:hypothetical protein [Desulfolithobacter sp.]